MRSSWLDGSALAALVDCFSPGIVSFDKVGNMLFTLFLLVVQKDTLSNAEFFALLIDLAFEKFQIPKIVDPTDLLSCDSLVVMTYVTFFRDYYVSLSFYYYLVLTILRRITGSLELSIPVPYLIHFHLRSLKDSRNLNLRINQSS